LTGAGTGDMLLQLQGVTGESSDAKHKDFIELESWSWSMLSPTDVSTGHAHAKVKIEHFKIVKRADRSSPVLIQYLQQNVIVKSGKLIVRKAGGPDALPYYEIEFKNLRVTSFSTQTEKENVLETVTFAFETATFKYIPQSETGAKGGGTVEYTVKAHALS
jgi:type VI secretion system secreted protein Hcp